MWLYVIGYLLLFVYEHHSLKEKFERFVKFDEETKKNQISMMKVFNYVQNIIIIIIIIIIFCTIF